MSLSSRSRPARWETFAPVLREPGQSQNGISSSPSCREECRQEARQRKNEPATDRCGPTMPALRRRDLISLLGGAAAAWPLAARAQDGRTYRIGVLNANPRGSPMVTALFDELRRNGLVEGRNLVVDGSGIGIPYPRFADAARELVKAKVEALVVGGGSPPVHSVQAVAPGIPIICVADDMVAAGLARSLVQPGGDVTGVSLFAPELDGKRQELLIELLPGVRRMAALADPRVQSAQQLQELQCAARARGVELSIHPVTSTDAIVPAINTAKAAGAGGLNFLAGPVDGQYNKTIIRHTRPVRL